ncbi:tetratricopeptide repeat protein [Dactylosporangium sp. CA-152071]|uniref:tetratricopeptide repeat protein n=1 Tax=Dactylosporangium sp. CA-152071 TaxID=3239933 RepID=UPI003D9469BD
MVTRLIELGHNDEVELQAGRGEWFCALELACRRPERAAALLAPFVATGWWTAVRAMAELLEGQDRIEELRSYAAADHHGHAARRLAELLEERGDVEGAIAAYRDLGDSGSSRLNCASYLAELLVRHGRPDEATEVLRELASTVRDDWSVDTLCAHYAAHGSAEDGLAFLDDLGDDDWEYFRIRLELMAGCGRLDEALELARAHPEGGTDYAAETVAGLLAGAGRTGEAVDVLERRDPGWVCHPSPATSSTSGG